MSSLPTPPAPPAPPALSAPRLPFPPSVPPESAYSNPEVDTSLRIGDLLEGRYQIEAPLGEGGVGVVYRALQLKLHRRVAVKLLQQEVMGEVELRPRFQQEALTLAALSHPHIVTLQDYGMVRGRPFLVMELLEGRTLRQIIDTEAPIAPLRTLALLRQVLLALAYAHEFGVVHRDLKPANLIVQALPAYEHVKVLDFGMVKLMPGSHLHRGEQLTRQGFTFGTPAYMSPEHAVGAEVDMRSDLYSVGVLLFELLTAHKPFDGEVQDVLRHHLNTPVPQLTERRPELAELSELQALVEKAMAKERDDRFASARDMLTAIDELLTSGMLAEPPAEDSSVDVAALSSTAPRLRDTLESAAAALSSYARASRDAWRDKASPQLRRAQRELRAAAAHLAPKLRGLSDAAWDKLRPQLVRAADRVTRIALEARSRIETRLHGVPSLPGSRAEEPGAATRASMPPLALAASTQEVELAETELVDDARATVIDAPRFEPALLDASGLGSRAEESASGLGSRAEEPRASTDAALADRREPSAASALVADDGSHTAEPLTLERRPERGPEE